jgi:beta-lactamase regulating signal transducer with metallopeptidase domain
MNSLAFLATDWLPAPAASTRTVAQLYALLLVTSAVLFAAGAAAIAARHAAAGTRALIWRAGVLALLAVYAGQLLPITSFTGTLPAFVAEPLVRLGRMQVALVEASLPGSGALEPPAVEPPHAGMVGLIRLLATLYWVGAAAMLIRIVAGWLKLRALARRSRPWTDAADDVLQDACTRVGIRRPVKILVSGDLAVPVTWGVLRPSIALPRSAMCWSRTERRAILVHELAHVCATDALIVLLANVMCALFWFHPGAWWLARRLRDECELACDDRVLAGGVRPSDYAELLLRTSDSARLAAQRPLALALSRRGDLRRRLASIVDVQRDRRAPGPAIRWAVVAVTLCVSLPASAARLTPSKDVLTELLRDPRWDSRAYAVVGLAQRPDSIDVARAASRLDPNPRVRAWARLALDGAPRVQPLPIRLNALPAPRVDYH